MAEELCFRSAIEIARLVRDRTVSAVEVVETFLARIEEINPRLRMAGEWKRSI